MSALPSTAADGWQPLSPANPKPDPEHEARTGAAVARALRDIPFYRRRGGVLPADSATGEKLAASLAQLPLLLKKDVRATLPKQWVPEGRDTRAELASGALELV